MKTSDLVRLTELKLAQEKYEDREIKNGYTSDLLSDVMANAGENALLITIQAHKNTVAVASLLDCAGIIVCNGKTIPEDMLKSAAQENIAVFSTQLNQFAASHLIYAQLNR
jgi:serine kinase of HPr protein (carbohydrate metabolism regulator)